MPTGVGEEVGLSDACVCTCGWVFACIIRVSRMCVRQHICLFLCVCLCVCERESLCAWTVSEDYTANVINSDIE